MVRSRSNRKKFIKDPVKLTALIVIAVLVVLGVLQLTHTINLFGPAKAVSGTIPTTTPNPSATPETKSSAPAPSSGSNASSQNTAASSTSSTKSQGSSTPPSTSSTQPPTVPYGTFVSNHRPTSSGSPGPNEVSVCYTTPGASCVIKFTQNSITRSLSSQTTNADGYASWNWDLNNAGLTTGSWQITAVATLNGQTAQATDPTSLEVQ